VQQITQFCPGSDKYQKGENAGAVRDEQDDREEPGQNIILIHFPIGKWTN
jgi:hypothetical protein